MLREEERNTKEGVERKLRERRGEAELENKVCDRDRERRRCEEES